MSDYEQVNSPLSRLGVSIFVSATPSSTSLVPARSLALTPLPTSKKRHGTFRERSSKPESSERHR